MVVVDTNIIGYLFLSSKHAPAVKKTLKKDSECSIEETTSFWIISSKLVGIGYDKTIDQNLLLI